jgi:LmbE family N-acetylglucosaminyl deacetylase
MNILIVSAHHDDLELGCGGTVARFVEEGHKVVSLVLTHSGYSDAQGNAVRDKKAALSEGQKAASILGYELIAHNEDTFDIQVCDANACKILDAITAHNIDTLFTHWQGDTHPAHNRVHALAMQAGRRVSRIFGFAANAYIGSTPFNPTTYVALEEKHWQSKVAALQAYATEFKRTGASWVDYYDRQSLNFGTQTGTPRAEGFVTLKNLWQIGPAGS